jgi:Berberine and berberine like
MSTRVSWKPTKGSDRSAFGVNYERLVVMKSKHDPMNLFRHDQNIKPTV